MMLATMCSSWVAISRGSSHRSCLVPSGNTSYTFVRRANKATSRTGVSSMFQQLFWMFFSGEVEVPCKKIFLK